MSQKSNSVLEDVAVEIGYTATAALVDWFGGGNLHVPLKITPDHVLAKVIGMAAANRLAKAWGTEVLALPSGYQREMDRRDRLIGALILKGMSLTAIARIANMNRQQIANIKARLVELGVMPLIARRVGIDESKTPVREITAENRVAKRRAKPG